MSRNWFSFDSQTVPPSRSEYMYALHVLPVRLHWITRPAAIQVSRVLRTAAAFHCLVLPSKMSPVSSDRCDKRTKYHVRTSINDHTKARKSPDDMTSQKPTPLSDTYALG